MILQSNNCLFVHNYKVAGTSIISALLGYQDYNKTLVKVLYRFGFYDKYFPLPSHSTATEYLNKFGKDKFSSYFKFGFVRDPWDWQVSLYIYMLENKKHSQHKLVKSFKNFDEYIDWRIDNNYKKQIDFFYDFDKNCLLDFIGKFENLNSDFNIVCQNIGINSRLPHKNKSNQKVSYLDYYSPDSIEKIYEVFREDVDCFGYSKPVLS